MVAVVPARDEAEIIGESIASLLQQDYRGDFAVIVVDDHSSDGTAAVAEAETPPVVEASDIEDEQQSEVDEISPDAEVDTAPADDEANEEKGS